MKQTTPILISESLRQKYKDYCSFMQEITGEDPEKPSRVRIYVTMRAMIAYRLASEYYPLLHIGYVMDKEHSTIRHYINKVIDFFTYPGFDSERELWDKFMNYKSEREA